MARYRYELDHMMSQLLSSGPILLYCLYFQNLETKDAKHDHPSYSVHAGHFLLWQLICKSPLGWNRSIASVNSRACELLIIQSHNSPTCEIRNSTVIWYATNVWVGDNKESSECLVLDSNKRSLSRHKKKEQGKLHKEARNLHKNPTWLEPTEACPKTLSNKKIRRAANSKTLDPTWCLR